MSASIYFHHHDDRDQKVTAEIVSDKTSVRLRFGDVLSTDLAVFVSKDAAKKLHDDLAKIIEAAPCETCKGTGVTP